MPKHRTKPTESPVSSLSREQTPQKPTPGTSGTQWSEDLFSGKQPKLHLISTLESSELTVPPFVEPPQTDEPPIPGLSPSSEAHEDVLTHEPEPEVAPTQSMEEPFACPTAPHSIIIIDNAPVGSPPPLRAPMPSSPQSHNDTRQEFTNLKPTLMISRALVHESINRILL
ncbi:hypothetical protein O181_127141 [Austropuccinia psidii MF-1]|uniref:Uncharacterized protein n=1 Tax=Austropuccinia psidii MF-1 TaxID=1389203 RepID=A0A9Q3KWF9_9BASI|nr:hypothetical protein [Austropuccinia psidii MF-1]